MVHTAPLQSLRQGEPAPVFTLCARRAPVTRSAGRSALDPLLRAFCFSQSDSLPSTRVMRAAHMLSLHTGFLSFVL